MEAEVTKGANDHESAGAPGTQPPFGGRFLGSIGQAQVRGLIHLSTYDLYYPVAGAMRETIRGRPDGS